MRDRAPGLHCFASSTEKAERPAATRTSFGSIVWNPEFLAEATQGNIDVDPMGGEDVGALGAVILTASPAEVEQPERAQEER